MTTTGELYAIIEELELVDIGDAASYLGEEADEAEESSVSDQAASEFTCIMEPFLSSECAVCPVC